MLAFILVLFVVLVIYTLTDYSGSSTKEGLDVVSQLPSPPYTTHISQTPKEIQPYESPSSVIPENIEGSKESFYKLDFSTPHTTKTQLEHIQHTVASMNDFFSSEVKTIQDKNDPSIQLPLEVTISDFKILKDELLVLNRNPGIEPSISEMQMNEIDANLNYLRRWVRLYHANQPYHERVEGFESDTQPSSESSVSKSPSEIPASKEDMILFVKKADEEMKKFTGTIVDDCNGNDTTRGGSGKRSTVYEAGAFETDPILYARIRNIKKIRDIVYTILDKLSLDEITPENVTIGKKDLENAFLNLRNMNIPLPPINLS